MTLAQFLAESYPLLATLPPNTPKARAAIQRFICDAYGITAVKYDLIGKS